MGFSPVKNRDGTLSIDAVLEASTLIGGVYWNRRDAVQSVLDLVGGGTIRAFQWQVNAWPPSWCLLQQGQQLYTVLAGSTSDVHWYGNITGAYAVQYPGFANFAHSFFLSVWQSFKIELLLNLPAGWQTMPMTFVGHSFGAAVAFLGALDWARTTQPALVEYLGFAKPKPLTGGYVGAFPAARFHVANQGDAVPSLPPNSVVLSVLDAASLYRYSVPMDWRHYSFPYQFQTDGSLREVSNTPFNQTPSVGLIATTPFSHPIANYMQAAETAWLAQIGTGRDAPLVGISRNIRSAASPQNLNVNIDFRQYIDIDQQNRDIFRSQPGGPLTPSNLPSVSNLSGGVLTTSRANGIFPAVIGVTSMAQKMTIFYHDNLAGFSESHLVPDQANLNAYITLASGYVSKRMDVSGPQTTVDWIRFSTLFAARRVTVITPFQLTPGTPITGTFGAGGHGGQSPSDFGGTAILLRKIAANGAFSHWFLRGVPDTVVDFGGLYSDPGGFTNAINRLAQFLNANTFAWPGTGKEPGPGFLLTALANNAVGQILFTAPGAFPAPGPGVPVTIRIRITGQATRPNLNGTWTVNVVDVNSAISRDISYLPQTPAVTGRIFKISSGGGTISTLSIERVTGRRVGRPFGLYRGRARNRTTA